jgi:hypothetical protein
MHPQADDQTSNGPASAPEGTFVGTIEGTDAYIALVSNGEEVAGFACDGTPKAVDVYF